MVAEFPTKLRRVLGLDHPWFRPMPRRIGTFAVCVLWFAMEFWGQTPFWMALSGAMAILTLWTLLLAYPKEEQADE